ncbi:MAG: RNA methyltransferase [Chloroflexi bacterium]|nr:RNA methyltransferase [Chloroflexota bacterium]
MLTSLANDRVKLVRALQSQRKAREKEGQFVVEGARLVEEALRANAPVDFALHTNDLDDRARAVLGQLRRRGATLVEVSPEVIKACSDTEHPQSVLAVLPITNNQLLKAGNWLLVICDRLSDPGNLGTLLRSAAAAGVDAALLAPGTVDAFNPKVVRAGMGAHFRLPIESLTWDKIGEKVKGLQVRMAEARSPISNLKSQISYDQADWTQPSAFIISSEADGPSEAARACAAESVFIPMPGETESLNAAVAGSVILFEAVRQRNDIQPPTSNL